MRETDDDFFGEDGEDPEEEGEKKKIFGMSRGIFAALASESLLIIVLIAVVIAMAAGRRGKDGGGSESGEEWVAAEQSTAIAARTMEAPNLVGQTWSEELKASLFPIVPGVTYDPDSSAMKDLITGQNPAAGKTLYSDSSGVFTVEITVSGNKFSDRYSGLVGKTLEEAMDWLENCGVKKADVTRRYAVSSSGVGDGRVSAFTYEDGSEVMAGEKLREGGRFVITLNSYTHPVTVPLLGGKSFDEAAEALYGSELNIGEVGYKESGMADGTVLSQTPAEYETAYCGDRVDLVLSRRGNAFPMPSLLGLTLEEAEACLKSRGLELGTVGGKSCREYGAGQVCAQSVAENEDVYAAAVIDIDLTLGGKADDSVDWNADTVVIDISENAQLSAGTVEKLAARGEGRTAIAKSGVCTWTFPPGLRYPEGDAGLDLALAVNGGGFCSKAAALLVKEGFEAGDFAVIAYANAQELPEGLELSVNLGASFGGARVRLLCLDEGAGAFRSFSDEVCEVGKSGFLDFVPGKAKVYAAVRETREFCEVEVVYDGDEVFCEEGAAFSTPAGESLTLHLSAKEGFVLWSVSLDGVKLEGAAGKNSFVYTVPAVGRDLSFAVTAKKGAESGGQPPETSAESGE